MPESPTSNSVAVIELPLLVSVTMPELVLPWPTKKLVTFAEKANDDPAPVRPLKFSVPISLLPALAVD